MKNDGIAYELFVQKVQQALIDGQQLGGYRTINVQHDVTLVGKNGQPRQFDLYWEFELGGYTYRNVIECKDYADDIPVGKVDELAGKLKSFPELKGIIATRNGFQSGAIRQAKDNGIDVIVVRDEDPARDWVDASGTPLLREIDVKFRCVVPWRFRWLSLDPDREWCKANGISVLRYNCSLKDVVIEDSKTGVSRSIEEIVDAEGEQGRSEYKLKQTYEEAYIRAPNQPRVRIRGFELAYYGSYIIEHGLCVRPEVLGVVEYVGQKRKNMVLKFGNELKVVTQCQV